MTTGLRDGLRALSPQSLGHTAHAPRRPAPRGPGPSPSAGTWASAHRGHRPGHRGRTPEPFPLLNETRSPQQVLLTLIVFPFIVIYLYLYSFSSHLLEWIRNSRKRTEKTVLFPPPYLPIGSLRTRPRAPAPPWAPAMGTHRAHQGDRPPPLPSAVPGGLSLLFLTYVSPRSATNN